MLYVLYQKQDQRIERKCEKKEMELLLHPSNDLKSARKKEKHSHKQKNFGVPSLSYIWAPRDKICIELCNKQFRHKEAN